jgi:predicted dehydrogenase
MKIAFIGASHWHFPLYIDWLQPSKRPAGLKVIGLSDPDLSTIAGYARKLETEVFTDYKEMIDRYKPDFVYAFGQHNEQAQIAHDLIDRGIAFTIEKPLGLTGSDVERVQNKAEQKGVYCAIPFVWRYSALVDRFKQISPDDFIHLSFKFIAGPPSRYTKSSPWMLVPELSGGGCVTNLAVHFIDLALYLTNSPSAVIQSANYHYLDPYKIETFGTTTMKSTKGASMTIETGYAFPMDEQEKRVNRWDIVTKDGYHVISDNTYVRRIFGTPTEINDVNLDSDIYYEVFAKESLAGYVNEEIPKASLLDMMRVRYLLDEIIASSRR